jgi:hypothetical protein
MALMTKSEFGYPVLRDEWTPEDINGIAQDMGIGLTYDQCVEVLQDLAKNYNTEHGITLEGIQLTIEFIDDESKPIDSFFGDIDEELSKLTIRK